MAKKTRLEELQEYAKDVGVTVRTWSPGDGVTRYRFFDKPGPGQTYFGPASGMYTALGLKDAWNYLYGYGAGGSQPSHARKKENKRAPKSRAHATKANWPYDVSVGDEVYAVAGGRRRGPGIVEEIYDDGSMRVDFTRQFDGRLQLRPEDLILVPGHSHARKKKLTNEEAKRLLESEGVDFSGDYHELVSMSTANRIAEVAKMAGYRKRKDAPGSTARMYFQYLNRLK